MTPADRPCHAETHAWRHVEYGDHIGMVLCQIVGDSERKTTNAHTC